MYNMEISLYSVYFLITWLHIVEYRINDIVVCFQNVKKILFTCLVSYWLTNCFYLGLFMPYSFLWNASLSINELNPRKMKNIYTSFYDRYWRFAPCIPIASKYVFMLLTHIIFWANWLIRSSYRKGEIRRFLWDIKPIGRKRCKCKC